MNEYAIEVKNLCIHYKGLKSYYIKQSLLSRKRQKAEVFQAVKNVSFSVREGEILGLVGKNGSGKSTILNAVAGIFAPNSGTIDLHGHSVSLLSIGVGFQRELSGRENIILSGMLLGFSEKQVRERMEEIIEFSELGEFIEAPVRTYSSGMYSKLAFSIIDEVLSVGDAKFKKKSYNKMKELIEDENRTVIIVSHSAETIRKLCDRVLWIDAGEVRMFGETDVVMREYEKFMS